MKRVVYKIMDEEDQKKVSLPEAIMLFLYIGGLDLVGLLLIFFALDDFGIIDILSFPVTQFYFRMKGIKATADLVGNLVELIPYVGALPIRTITLASTIYIANHPKLVSKVSSVAPRGSIAGKI